MLTRRSAVAPLVAACAATALATAPEANGSSARLSRAEQDVIRLINRVRGRHRLPVLRPSRHLARAADRHSQDMLRHDFFAHASSDGTPFDRRVRSYARARRVGEDLALTRPARGVARSVVTMWLHSPPHRSVLLSAGYRRIGVGNLSGALGARLVTVVTADFASRR